MNQYKRFENIAKDKNVDLSTLTVGDEVHLANGATYEVGDIRTYEIESHEGVHTAFRLNVGRGSKHSWGYENYTEVIGGGLYSMYGSNQGYPHLGSGIQIIRISKCKPPTQ